MRLSGHHALVTGAGTGIGAAIAKALAREGARLTLVGRRREKLESVASEVGGALVAPADVTARGEVTRAFDLAREAQGPITILVNNAGAAASRKFAATSEADWNDMLSVNLTALFHCCQEALPDLLGVPQSRIVTIASTAGLKGYGYTAAYAAAKHGAIGLTRSLAVEYARTGLTVNAVCPGFTRTELTAGAIENIRRRTGRTEAEAIAELSAFNPQRRMVEPEEVAGTVVWLCLGESASINGQAIAVAGGEVM
jgi:NAD(P)-dependent dehydrogenase (short-subunit alcohol dehydrogenase family)